MYIAPNSTIKIIYQCPLDKSYENTLWFDTLAEQTAYFITTLGGYTFQNNSYQRVKKGVLRIAKPAEEMYDCNYLAFKNTSFGTKWFYAFIDKIEYVNNITSEIYYTIDVIQTWHFDYFMEQCFVEREHSTTDEIGDNIVDEKLDTGEYISDGITYLGVSGCEIAIWGTIDENYDPVGGVLYWATFNGETHYYPSGLYAVRFPVTQQGLTDAYNWLINLPPLSVEKVVCITIIPNIAGDYVSHRVSISKASGISRNGGSIKNNKLYTYPYNALYISNNQGKSALYRYEFFETETCDFDSFCEISPNCTYTIMPRNYKGSAVNFDERLDMTGFPQVAYNVDSFKAWLAQTMSSGIFSNLSAGIGLFTLGNSVASASTAMIPYTGAAAGGLAAGALVAPEAALAAGVALSLPVIRNIISGGVKLFEPPQSKGQQGGMMLVALDKLRFMYMKKYITKEYATIIDDYFTMYGYQTNKVKYPNRDTRPEWNYVKTVGCKIRSGIPSDDATAIESLYDRGIRFWKNPQHIGNYSFDNSPVTQNNPNIPSG